MDYDLNIKGYYMLKYCKKIVLGEIEEKDMVEDYENFLQDLIADHPDTIKNRFAAANVLITLLSRLEPDEDLKEMGITHL